MYEVRKNDKWAKLYRYFYDIDFDYEMPKGICVYVWKLILAVLLIAPEEMIAKLSELEGKIELLTVDSVRKLFWVLPMRKNNVLIDYLIMQDIDYKKD